jgi:hypothetical protein
MNRKNHVRCSLAVFAATLLLPVAALAQKIVFTAEIDADQEVGVSTSPATGHAVMRYDVEANTFDLTVKVRGLTEMVAASHIHQAPAGANGPVVVGLGGEAVYRRAGNNLFLQVKDQPYTGDPVQLLMGGAYYNLHTATFPAGAIRGQLLPHTVEFFTVMTGDQEATPTDSRAKGLAFVRYDLLEDTVDVYVKIFNFKNTLTASHIHEAPPGVAGPVTAGLGGAAAYQKHGNNYSGVFLDVPYSGDVLTLLDGGAYINVHSNVFPAGEIRGQLRLAIPCRRK